MERIEARIHHVHLGCDVDVFEAIQVCLESQQGGTP